MATFEYQEGNEVYIQLVAEIGEELPTDMVQAYALLRTAAALEAIEGAIVNMGEEITGGLRRVGR